MKHFEVGNDVILTKEYNWLIRTNDEQCRRYSDFKLGDIFTIIKSENHGFILEKGKTNFLFCDDFMQKYFDIKTEKNLLRIDNDYLEFIEECCPSFRRNSNDELEMFSCPTQWIKGTSAKELLDQGVEAYKEFGNMSPMSKYLKDLETEEIVIGKDIKLSKEDINKLVELMKESFMKLISPNI